MSWQKWCKTSLGNTVRRLPRPGEREPVLESTGDRSGLVRDVMRVTKWQPVRPKIHSPFLGGGGGPCLLCSMLQRRRRGGGANSARATFMRCVAVWRLHISSMPQPQHGSVRNPNGCGYMLSMVRFKPSFSMQCRFHAKASVYTLR